MFKEISQSQQMDMLQNKYLIYMAVAIAVSLLTCYIVVANSYTRVVYTEEWQSVESKRIIHLATPIMGSTTSMMAITMLKSILYQLGRYNTSDVQCSELPIFNHTKRDDSNIQIHYHIATDERTQKVLESYFSIWNPDSIHPIYYDIEPILDKAKHFRTKHYGGYASLSKLWLPDVLPLSVDKIIIVDADFIFMNNIQSLWDHFNSFKANQVIAMAEEQCTCYRKAFGDRYLPDFPYGYNGGLVLMDLQKARQRNWSSFWVDRINPAIRHFNLITGDQDILNVLAHENKDILYILPCAWNMVVNFDYLPRCECSWIPFTFDDKPPTTNSCEISAIHFNKVIKPEHEYLIGQRLTLDETVSRPSTGYLYRKMYAAVYMTYRNIEFVCLKN